LGPDARSRELRLDDDGLRTGHARTVARSAYEDESPWVKRTLRDALSRRQAGVCVRHDIDADSSDHRTRAAQRPPWRRLRLHDARAAPRRHGARRRDRRSGAAVRRAHSHPRSRARTRVRDRRRCRRIDRRSEHMTGSTSNGKTMKRVVVDHYGGPEVWKVTEDDVPGPGPAEVRVRGLAAGVSFTDAQLRAGTYLGVPNPPFTPGYELVGVVEKLGPGCARLKVGDRIGTLTVWGADAERVCVLEANAVEVPEDLDPAEVLSLVFTYMTAYQVLHRRAKVKSGETVLVHGAAGRVGVAVLELGTAAGLRMYGTCAARDIAAVEKLGAVAIDYRNEDFLARVRKLPGGGVDVMLDGIGGPTSLRSFRGLRPGGRLVLYGHYHMPRDGRRSWPPWIQWYAATAPALL